LKDVDNSAKYTAAIIMDEEETKGVALTSRKQPASIKHQAQSIRNSCSSYLIVPGCFVQLFPYKDERSMAF
jgi:hypothetical protein